MASEARPLFSVPRRLLQRTLTCWAQLVAATPAAVDTRCGQLFAALEVTMTRSRAIEAISTIQPDLVRDVVHIGCAGGDETTHLDLHSGDRAATTQRRRGKHAFYPTMKCPFGTPAKIKTLVCIPSSDRHCPPRISVAGWRDAVVDIPASRRRMHMSFDGYIGR